MKSIRTLLVAAVCLASLMAQAQWQWIDKDGRKVFSDRAPPSDVPAKNILKQPGSATRGIDAMANAAPATAASAPVATGAGTESTASLEAPKLSAVDKELTDKKKLAEAAAAAKTRADEERVAKSKVENCERAKSNKALMESGVRVSQTDAKGERVILDDSGRMAEIKRAQLMMDANCK